GLFAYDIYSSREGALPEIREGLKAAEVKNEVRNEISAAVEAELALEAPQIARDVADELYELWTDFLRKYQQMLELARQEPLFAGLLTQATDLSKLASLVDAVVAVLGDDDLAQALADGTFARA